ncbi:ankyrin repeat domain-containing protein 31 [Balaenoptera musculus]|uniref:Ankyrin repeat domain-containing protein 31 n=1 Tax=Balaenoptera musculus TaxID=9771 RepID=A0A8B8X630_BALMU|nr:ankyrin repeat domain-containing protein 31 [Balaenoptera musculus]
MEELEKEDKKDLECEAEMEEGAQAPDWDSDETVIEASVTESDQEEEELPWRRLIFNQDTSLRSEFSLHPAISRTCKGTSPEIQLGFRLREDPQEQMNKNQMMPILSEDAVLQQPQDEMEQNEAPLQIRKSCPVFTVSFPQAELSLNHQSIQGPEAEDPKVLTHPEKELSRDRDSPEISLLSSTTIKEFDTFAIKENSLIEPEKEPSKEVTLTMTSEETKDEESSLETFVSALEKLLTSPEITQEERTIRIMSDFERGELMNPLNNSSSSISIPLTCHKDLLESSKDDALPAESLAALNTLSEAKVEPICHRKEGDISLSAGNECLGVEPNMSQTDEDCTQIAEVNFETLCSTQQFEQDSKLGELQDKHLSVQQSLEDPNPFGLQTLVHQNVTSCDPLNNKGNSNPVENSSDQDTPCVLRRSSRLKVGRDAKPTDDMYKMPEKILPKILGCEDQTNNNSSTENFRMQTPALRIEGKGKTVRSSRLKSGKQLRKNRKLAGKNEKMKMNKVSRGNINRRNIFGENLLYKAALHNDANLVHHYMKKGGNVNQPSYAGWTALHEASVGGFYQTASELLKGGADVNIRGMYQITPLHDAVMNGHYKVAQLLLLNGADPLFRNDSGKCALDEAKDSCMKRLLERYVPKHQKHLTSAQTNSTDPSDSEDAHHHKKPKFSSKNHSGFVCDENSKRQKPEHVKVNKGSKEGLFINKEDVYEHYQKDSQNTKFGKSKHKRSTLSQIYSTGLRKDNLHGVEDPSTNVSKDKGRRNTGHKRTQVDDAIQESNPRKTIAVSSSRKTNRLVTCQQHTLQNLDDLPEKSCKSFSPALSGLKNGLGNDVETCSFPKETHTQSLDLSGSQEIKFLELESTDQAEAVSFSGLSLHKKTELPLVTTDQQPHTHQEQQHISPYKSNENSNSGQKDESPNKWEKFSPSFIKENFNNGDDGDSCAPEETVTFKKVISSSGCKNHDNYKENKTNREEMDFQQFLLSQDHFSQENELIKADSLTIFPQQEAVNFSNSDNIIVSEHVSNYEQCTCGTSLDHSHGSPERPSLACTRTLSPHAVSQLTSHVELFERPQGCSPRIPTPLMNQTDTHTVEKVNKEGDTKRNYTDKGQKPSSSNRPLSRVVHSQVIETTKVEKRRQEIKTIHSIGFQSTDNINKELTVSQLSQREEKEISHKPGEELTNNVNGDENTIRNCEEKKEKTDSEIHMPTNIQEHKKVQNFRKRQNFLKATCSQEMKTAGINKRNARGESRLHLAARRGDLSLVKARIESGADVNLKDNTGWTPLHEAASTGCNDIIVELLKAGANVNCENVDGILPLHDAVANNHLKAAEILLQHGANPNQKDQKQKTALDEADDKNMKELLKSYGAIETDNRDESNAVVTVKIPAIRAKRHKQCFCDDCKTVDTRSVSHQEKTKENLAMHQTISAILQDLEEKQENLLAFEIRTPEDAEQYIDKMLEIKEVMDNVLAKQKAERDDLAKKYRVSIESFKHGVLREQLANLATRQKSLLLVAKKQKKISQKIQNYKNVRSLSGLSFKKLPLSSEISNEKDSQEFTSLENSVQPQSGSFSPVSLVCGSVQETQLSWEIWHDNQNTNTCLNSKTVRREEFSGNELNSKQSVSDCTLDRLSKSRLSDGTKKIKLQSQPISFIAQAEYSQKENDLTDTTAKGHESFSPSAVTGTLKISETANVCAHNDASPSTVICDQALSNCDPKKGNRKTASQQPHRGTSESLVHQGIDVFGSNTGHQVKPYLKKSALAVPHANDSQSSSSSGSGRQHTIKNPSKYSTTPKKKCMQIKDLILLGRINPGNNILEFKTQETTHKASVLLNGKIKVENGQIYQNPVIWLKDLLGADSYVTWNYAWSKVTYQGKELLKYISEELPLPPDPNLVPQQHQPCLPGTSKESMQSIPHYLQINEILLISDQEFLPCHIMDEHWKFYVECEELTF